MKSLVQQVEGFVEWKYKIIQAIADYRQWLVNSKLLTDDLKNRLDRGLQAIKKDQITIAFVGEFSRGKTELINALFFSEFTQRVLPSYAGRTTMCPTEIFYDHDQPEPYLKLLPIETRARDVSVSQYKRIPQHWETQSLPVNDVKALGKVLASVAQTKQVPIQEAERLGFEVNMLDLSLDQKNVQIPVWRHALINLRHPLLNKGLRILDTPGLNALGSEPELTLRQLPSAQAIVYMLSADTGVTASDLQVWDDHIRHYREKHPESLFAVINKIDAIKDDLNSQDVYEANLTQVRWESAKLLGLPTSSVISISAKQALTGRIKQDADLVKMSRIELFESMLSDRLIACKEIFLEKTVVKEVSRQLENHLQLEKERLANLEHEFSLVDRDKVNQQDQLIVLRLDHKRSARLYRQRLSQLRESQVDFGKKLSSMERLLDQSTLEYLLHSAKNSLQTSWTTAGMKDTIHVLLDQIDRQVIEIVKESELATALLKLIYGKYITEYGFQEDQFPLKLFGGAIFVERMQELKQQTDVFIRSLRTYISKQSNVVRRFFELIGRELRDLFTDLRVQVQEWRQEAFMPLIQHTYGQKRAIEERLKIISELDRTDQVWSERTSQLKNYMLEIEKDIRRLQKLGSILEQPAPRASTQAKLGKDKIVSLYNTRTG